MKCPKCHGHDGPEVLGHVVIVLRLGIGMFEDLLADGAQALIAAHSWKLFRIVFHCLSWQRRRNVVLAWQGWLWTAAVDTSLELQTMLLN